MTFYVAVESSLPRLAVGTIGLDKLKMLARLKLELRWGREGDVRLVPQHVIENVLQGFLDAQQSVEAGRAAEALEHAHCIHWEQTVPLPEADVALDVAPSRADQHSRRSRVGTPT